ncbi:MAG: hypothetical protein M1377_03290 [Deltaproteobacteria bacterium]|nr:hypothetical protein [Deltaproteobacteria bacterium]
MSDLVANAKTSLAPQDVIIRAVQFFSTKKWRASSQSERIATFDGKFVPWGLLILTIVGFLACLVPGIIMYIIVLRKAMQFQTIVVTANPIPEGSDVVLKYSKYGNQLVAEFLSALPPVSQ